MFKQLDKNYEDIQNDSELFIFHEKFMEIPIPIKFPVSPYGVSTRTR